MRASPYPTYLLALGAGLFTVATVLYPEVAFRSALDGLRLWWEIVFPALLPFFILSQMLMGLGVVHWMGVLLEPLMRPVFRVPGAGSFVMAMGLASGYPIGCMLTARLREQGLVTRLEGERLMSFTNTADPLFMAGAVAVGMFGRPETAGTIMAAHYLAALGTGLALRLHGRNEQPLPSPVSEGSLLARAARALVEARKRDGRPLGQLMGDCIRDAVNTLLLIGGFITLFMVLIRVLTAVGAAKALAWVVAMALGLLGMHPGTAPALVSGFFEITVGCQVASQAPAPAVQQLMAAGAVIAWSGLSVHAQVAALIRHTDLRLGPYLVARLIHAVLAAGFTLLLDRSGVFAWAAVPVLAPAGGVLPALAGSVRLAGQVLSVLVLAACAVLVADLARRAKVTGFRVRSRSGRKPPPRQL